MHSSGSLSKSSETRRGIQNRGPGGMLTKQRLVSKPKMAHTDPKLAELADRLSALDRERASIVAEIDALRSTQAFTRSPPTDDCTAQHDGHIQRHSNSESKIALFRRLFRGRTEVFPLRWENAKSGRSGYSPACANEWRRGICEKPKVKCSVCPNQAFISVDVASIERHLRGPVLTGRPSSRASIQYSRTIAAGFLPRISTKESGGEMFGPSPTHAVAMASPSQSNDLAPETAPMPGFSLRKRCRRHWQGVWAPF